MHATGRLVAVAVRRLVRFSSFLGFGWRVLLRVNVSLSYGNKHRRVKLRHLVEQLSGNLGDNVIKRVDQRVLKLYAAIRLLPNQSDLIKVNPIPRHPIV